jgi:cytochrome c556
MKNPSRVLTLLGALVVPMLVISCSQSAAPVVDDSPEGQAFLYRKGLMDAAQWKMARLNGMADGSITADAADFAKSARDLAAIGGMLTEGFIPNSGSVAGTAAQPAVWTNWSDFQQKANDLATKAQSLADAAASQGFDAAKGMVAEVRGTCGGCHRTYRRRDE